MPAPSLTITRTTPIYHTLSVGGVFVQWHVNDPETDYTFRVERSESYEGPFETLVPATTDFHAFDPHEISSTLEEEARNFLSLQRKNYYRVTATAPGKATFSDTKILGDELARRQWLLKRKILRDITIGFKFNSIPFAILKRKHAGTRCTACFDPISKSILDSRCKTCLGTGYITGYYAPVYVSARKGVTNVTTTLAPQGKTEVNQVELTVLDYPAVEVDDIIVEVRQGRRYLVKHVARTELRGVPVHQRLVMSELARDSVEYKIVLQPRTSPALY